MIIIHVFYLIQREKIGKKSLTSCLTIDISSNNYLMARLIADLSCISVKITELPSMLPLRQLSITC